MVCDRRQASTPNCPDGETYVYNRLEVEFSIVDVFDTTTYGTYAVDPSSTDNVTLS